MTHFFVTFLNQKEDNLLSTCMQAENWHCVLAKAEEYAKFKNYTVLACRIYKAPYPIKWKARIHMPESKGKGNLKKVIIHS